MLKASVIGNLGSEPEMKYSANGAPFRRFNVASNFRARTPEGQWEDKTEWIRCTLFGQRAESLSQHLRKGMRVYVDGRLEARPWTDQQGEVRAGLEMVASEVEFLSPRRDDDQGTIHQTTARMPQATAVHGAHPPRRTTAVAERDRSGDLDDLPF